MKHCPWGGNHDFERKTFCTSVRDYDTKLMKHIFLLPFHSTNISSILFFCSQISSGEHLQDLSRLRFLVIDEADRMVSQSSFPQLLHIFNAIHSANPIASDDSEEEDSEDEDTNEGRLMGLPGVPGEAKVGMLGDVLERMRQQEEGGYGPEPMELSTDEYEELRQEQEQQQYEHDDDDDDIMLPSAPPVYRQTFVYSATLTLPPSADYVQKVVKGNKTKKRGKAKKPVSVEGAIAEILEKARATGRTKIVDLTTSSDKRPAVVSAAPSTSKQTTRSSSSRLPPGLSLYKIECTQRHKDSHLYAYLVTSAQGASGPCLVFCNSIAAVKRVGATLQALKLPVRMLHANMAQVRVVMFRLVVVLAMRKTNTLPEYGDLSGSVKTVKMICYSSLDWY